MKIKVKKDDNVLVIAGREKGKKGKVISVYPEAQRVLIANVNLRKKTLRQQDQMIDKNFAEREVPIHISNVMVICPHCKKPARIGRRDEKNHTRFCRKCGKDID